MNRNKYKINHKEVCEATLIYRRCGRPGCIGCIVGASPVDEDEDPKLKGLCVICANKFTEDEIILHKSMEWDT